MRIGKDLALRTFVLEQRIAADTERPEQQAVGSDRAGCRDRIRLRRRERWQQRRESRIVERNDERRRIGRIHRQTQAHLRRRARPLRRRKTRRGVLFGNVVRRVERLDVQIRELAELHVQLAVDAVVLFALHQVLKLREAELALRQSAAGANAAAQAFARRIDEDVRHRGERRNDVRTGTAARGEAALRSEIAIERRHREVAIDRIQLRAMTIAGGDQHVVRVAAMTPEQVGRVVAVAVLDRGIGAIDREALEAAPRSEVDHARDRVRAVSRRSAVLQHFDSLDGSERQQVHVDTQQRDRRRRQASAVEQHERPAAIEASQVDVDCAGPEQHAARVRFADSSLRQRKRANHIEDRRRALSLDLAAIDHRDRQRGVFHCPFDVGAGDDDLLDRIFSRSRRECRERSCGNCRTQDEAVARMHGTWLQWRVMTTRPAWPLKGHHYARCADGRFIASERHLHS